MIPKRKATFFVMGNPVMIFVCDSIILAGSYTIHSVKRPAILLRSTIFTVVDDWYSEGCKSKKKVLQAVVMRNVRMMTIFLF